jgi:predicted component of type VI protein secretion system
MKLHLVVLVPGKSEGQAIPITSPQFFVGRDRHCQLRPSSPEISNRHCALVLRDGRAFLRDFDSTNGTFLNGQRIQGEMRLLDGDCLRVGPLTFLICIEPDQELKRARPATRMAAAAAKEDTAAQMLLANSPHVENSPPKAATHVSGETLRGESQMSATVRDTAVAAKEILAKYIRRPR